MRTRPQGDLAEKLAEITPGDLKKSFFTSSGTEADDTAIHGGEDGDRQARDRRPAAQLFRAFGDGAFDLSDIRPGGRCPRRSRASFTRWRRTAIAVRSERRPTIAALRARTTLRR